MNPEMPSQVAFPSKGFLAILKSAHERPNGDIMARTNPITIVDELWVDIGIIIIIIVMERGIEGKVVQFSQDSLSIESIVNEGDIVVVAIGRSMRMERCVVGHDRDRRGSGRKKGSEDRVECGSREGEGMFTFAFTIRATRRERVSRGNVFEIVMFMYDQERIKGIMESRGGGMVRIRSGLITTNRRHG
jgi:hypothetical protein